MSNPIQVVTTTAQRDEALAIARKLVESRLAACVQVHGPVSSTYRWQQEIETSQEWLCVAKTELSRYAEVERAIRQMHSYDLPEIVAMPIVAGSQDYLDWLENESA